MAAGKAKQDPFAKTREKIPSLQSYVADLRNRLASKSFSPKHKTEGQRAAFADWLRLEIRRTEAKISELKFSLPAEK
jgi:hypothetical protein